MELMSPPPAIGGTGGGVGHSNGAFFWPTTIGPYIFTSNWISTGGFFYGLRAGFSSAEFIRHNHIAAVHRVGNDRAAGYRGIYRTAAAINVRDNKLVGWTDPYYGEDPTETVPQ